MNVNILLISKENEIKETYIKQYNVDTLYKKCNFKIASGFGIQHTWNIIYKNINYDIELYGKIQGRNNILNTYIFPSNLSKQLYGKVILICKKIQNNISDYIILTLDLWNIFYKIIQSTEKQININGEKSNTYNDKISNEENGSCSEYINNDNKNKNKNKNKNENENENENNNISNTIIINDYELSEDEYI
jgi:hypothetical protein